MTLLPPPLSIHFEMGEALQWEADSLVQFARQLEHSEQYPRAAAFLALAVRIAPNHAGAQNEFAWLLSIGPLSLRNAMKALTAARQAVKLRPNVSTYDNTLGVALYRAGHFAEAVPVLERSLGEGKERGDSFDLFFLAMCHHRLGHSAKAREYRNRAVDWFVKHKAHLLDRDESKELTAFQAECDAVLAQPAGPARPRGK
jgi:Tfp pilus assembly protein PilF